jgi:pimeloyl-ACP methyl ester carboxylesterase
MKPFKKIILTITIIFLSLKSFSQGVPYGNNPAAGHYIDIDGTKIYYEIYGTRKPLVMLHGGVYGYIDEFAPFIPKLAENLQVICIATRGHGKSEMGKDPFTYKQRADDAYKVIRTITKDSVIVIGFSDGGMSGLKLAALYPELVKKLIVMGVGDRPKDRQHEKLNYTPEKLMKSDSAFFASRLKLMAEPDRWGECLSKLNDMYNNDYMSKETLEKIKCPVLLMNGDQDGYSTIDEFIQCSKYIHNTQVAVIPGMLPCYFFLQFSRRLGLLTTIPSINFTQRRKHPTPTSKNFVKLRDFVSW